MDALDVPLNVSNDRPPPQPNGGSKGRRLSYKFQRLREEIRSAILKGEFVGRLPGERELGRRYQVNAKTVNKALCDLSSEGLLVRHIGRGTFVAQNGQNGHNGQSGERGKTFRCLLPATIHKLPYREAVMEALSRALAAEHHNVKKLIAVGANGSPEIPLHCWPAATRSSTHGLIVYPKDPLSGHWGRLNEACLEEAWRRHVAVVVLGGLAQENKLDAVVPDFVDAGFRLTEFLIRVGCREIRVLVNRTETREAKLVVSGCHSAGARFNRPIRRAALSDTRGTEGKPVKALGHPEIMSEPSLHSQSGIKTGLICVGAAVTQAASVSKAVSELRAKGDLTTACILEAGDPMAGRLRWTAYEVDSERIATWGVRLLVESKPGRTPVEIIVPGEVVIREPGVTA